MEPYFCSFLYLLYFNMDKIMLRGDIMALIAGVNLDQLTDQHREIVLDFNTRTFSGLDGYVVAVVGDQNSQELTIVTPRYYDDIDLSGLKCNLVYWTSWVDDSNPPKHSSDAIELSPTDQSSEDKLYYTWVLDKRQTAKPGQCLFKMVWTDSESDYKLSTKSGDFIIVDSGMGTGSSDIILPDTDTYSKDEINEMFFTKDEVLEAILTNISKVYYGTELNYPNLPSVILAAKLEPTTQLKDAKKGDFYLNTEEKSVLQINKVYFETIIIPPSTEEVVKDVYVEYSPVISPEVGRKTNQNGEIFNDYENNQALGSYSHAEGQQTTAISFTSHASGESTIAGTKGFVIKDFSVNAKTYTLDSVDGIEVGQTFSIIMSDYFYSVGKIISIEQSTKQVFVDTFAGVALDTSDNYFIIEGKPEIGSTDIGKYAYVEGYTNKATGIDAHAEGAENIAFGGHSHAEGRQTKALHKSAHAEGRRTTASGNSSHAEGLGTTASGHRSHAEGSDTQAIGNHSHAEGYETIASAEGSHSEGYGAKVNHTATAGHAEGKYTKVYGIGSHAEGLETVAGNDSNTTLGNATHAEGYKTVANQNYAHAEGSNTKASGVASHAGGIGTKATAEAQTAIGKYNAVNNNALAVVGNGTSDNDRSNAFEVLKDGRVTIQSEPKNDIDGVNKGYLNNNYYTKSKAANAIINNVNKSGTIIIQPNEQNIDITLSNTGKSIAVCDNAENKIHGNVILDSISGFKYNSTTGYYEGNSSYLLGQIIIENHKPSKQYLVTIEGYGSVRIYTYYWDGTRDVNTVYFQKTVSEPNIYFGITQQGKDVESLRIWHESGNRDCGLKNLKVYECDSAKIYSDTDNNGIINNVQLYSPTTQILINDLNTSINFDYAVDTKRYIDSAIANIEISGNLVVGGVTVTPTQLQQLLNLLTPPANKWG